MLRFVALKFRQIVPVVVLVTFLTTLLAGLIPGSPAYAIYGEVPDSFVRTWNFQHGLDYSVWVQYWHWVYHAFHGDLGTSWESIGAQTVRFLLGQRIPVTAEIAVGAMLLSLIIAIPMAMTAALRPGGAADRVITSLASLFASTPPFISGIFLVSLLAVHHRIFPSQGWVPITTNLGTNLRDAFLPAITLVLVVTPILLRVLRGDLVSILNEDFVAAARSRGIPEWYIMTRHVLRPASASLITVAGLSFGSLLGGSIIVEIFFNLPGVGFLAIQAVQYKDIPVLQGIVVCVSLFFVVINTLIDLTYGILDPRVRIS